MIIGIGGLIQIGLAVGSSKRNEQSKADFAAAALGFIYLLLTCFPIAHSGAVYWHFYFCTFPFEIGIIPADKNPPYERHIMNDQLYEIGNCRKIQDEPRRRWFSNRNVDLIVWCGEKNQITGFQFCYKEGASEYAVT